MPGDPDNSQGMVSCFAYSLTGLSRQLVDANVVRLWLVRFVHRTLSCLISASLTVRIVGEAEAWLNAIGSSFSWMSRILGFVVFLVALEHELKITTSYSTRFLWQGDTWFHYFWSLRWSLLHFRCVGVSMEVVLASRSPESMVVRNHWTSKFTTWGSLRLYWEGTGQCWRGLQLALTCNSRLTLIIACFLEN